jgi:excinuclease UvrABC ATPase subunit
MPIILMGKNPTVKIEGLDLIDKVINIDQSPIGEHHVLIHLYRSVY